MNIAFISPIKHLEDTYATGYYMVLAQLLDQPAYKKFYSPQNIGRGTVILDNGAAENELITDEQLAKAIDWVQPDVVIAPDDLNSWQRTAILTDLFLCESQAFKMARYHAASIMLVPHGDTEEEWRTCLQVLMEISRPVCEGHRWIGIARKHTFLTEHSAAFGRLELAQHCQRYYPDVPIHLLGLATNPLEIGIFAQAGLRNVLGIDTALPWVAAERGVLFSKAGLLQRPNTWHSDEFAEYDQGVISLAQTNMRWMLNLIEDRDQASHWLRHTH